MGFSIVVDVAILHRKCEKIGGDVKAPTDEAISAALAILLKYWPMTSPLKRSQSPQVAVNVEAASDTLSQYIAVHSQHPETQYVSR